MQAVIDHQLPPPSLSQRTIQPKAPVFCTLLFYATKDWGTIRARFRMQDNKLYYRVNGTDIYCGHAIMKTSTQQ